MKDRLSEMQVIRHGRGRGGSSESNDSNEKDKLLSKEQWESVDKYLQLADRIRIDLDAGEGELKRIIKLHSDQLIQPPTPEATEELSVLTAQLTQKLKQITQELKVWSLESAQMSKGDAVTTAKCRIQRDQLNGLTRSLNLLQIKFSEEQENFRTKSKKKYKDYLKIIGMDIPEDVLEEAIERGTIQTHVKGVILAHDEKKKLYEDVKNRNDALIELEKSIRELAEMFHDLHLLVVSQGEMLDHIAHNVGLSVDYAVQASKSITAAQKMKRRAQYMKVGLIVGVIILILLLFLILRFALCIYLPFVCSK